MSKMTEYIDTSDLEKSIIGAHRWIRPRMQQYFTSKKFIPVSSIENYLNACPKSREFTEEEREILRYSLRFVFMYKLKYAKAASEDLFLKPTRLTEIERGYRLPAALKNKEVLLRDAIIPTGHYVSLVGIRLPNQENNGYVRFYLKKGHESSALEDSQVFLLEGRTR